MFLTTPSSTTFSSMLASVSGFFLPDASWRTALRETTTLPRLRFSLITRISISCHRKPSRLRTGLTSLSNPAGHAAGAAQSDETVRVLQPLNKHVHFHAALDGEVALQFEKHFSRNNTFGLIS